MMQCTGSVVISKEGAKIKDLWERWKILRSYEKSIMEGSLLVSQRSRVYVARERNSSLTIDVGFKLWRTRHGQQVTHESKKSV